MAKAKTTTTASKLYTRAQRMTRAWLKSSGCTIAHLARATGVSDTTIHRLKHKQHVGRTTTLAQVITGIKKLQHEPKRFDPPKTKAKAKTKGKKTKIKKAKGFTSPKQMSLPNTDTTALDAVVLSLEERLAGLSREALTALRSQIEKMNKAPDLRAEVVALRETNAELTKVNLELRNMADANGARVADLLNQVLDLRAGR